jgi:uncharacterized protein YegL
MHNNPFKNQKVEYPRNSEQKCLCVLCLDVSASMAEPDNEPISALNAGLEAFVEAIKEDEITASRLEVAIITFDDEVNYVQEPDLVDYVTLPTLRAGGTTKLADGVQAAIRKIDERKQYYRQHNINYYRPFIILMTDGEPDPDQDLTALSQRIAQGTEGNHFTFWAIGSQNYNHAKLASICPASAPPKPLKGVKYREFFQWLSNSMGVVSKSVFNTNKINFKPTSAWEELDNFYNGPSQSPIS